MLRRITAVALSFELLLACACAVARGGPLAAGSHQQLIDRVLADAAPGEHGEIQRGFTLHIDIPRRLGSPLHTSDYTPAWRAGLAAGELALRLPKLRQWTSVWTGTNQFYNVRDPFKIPHFEDLSLTAAQQQLANNLQVLSAGIPASANLHVDQSLIPLALAHNRFAFLINITVNQLDDLHRYYGDLALGPETGLINEDQSIEGMAVYVTDAHGHSLGAWSAVRDDEGGVDYGPGDDCLQVTLPFQDSHGHPPLATCHG
jgi:hypothetical protein